MHFLVHLLALMAAFVYAATTSNLFEVVELPKSLTSSGKIVRLPLNGTYDKRDGGYIETYRFTMRIGGGGGHYFADHFKENTDNQGHWPDWSLGAVGLVKRLTVWWKNDNVGIHGIQVRYQDGTDGPVHGSRDGKQDSVDIMAGVTVKELHIWGNGVGTRTGRIRIKLSDGTVFEKGKDAPNDGYEQDVSSTSGLLTGIFGMCGDDVDSLGFTFIMPVSDQRVTNLVFDDNIIGTNKDLEPRAFDTIVFHNPTDVTQDRSSATDTFSWTTTQSWTHQLSLKLGISYSIKAGLPIVAEQTTTVTWEMGYTFSKTDTVSLTHTFTSAAACNVPPHSTCEVDMFINTGELKDLAYTADVQINVNGWDGWIFKERGLYSQVASGNVQQTYKIAPLGQ